MRPGGVSETGQEWVPGKGIAECASCGQGSSHMMWPAMMRWAVHVCAEDDNCTEVDRPTYMAARL